MKFLQKREASKFALLVQLLPLVSPWRWAKSKKNKFLHGKVLTIQLLKHGKTNALSLLPIPGKIRLLLSLFGLFLAGNKAWSHIQGSKSKFDIPYLQSHNSWATLYQKSLLSALTSFAAIGTKRHFSKILTWIFKFGCFSQYHAHVFDKNEFDFLI